MAIKYYSGINISGNIVPSADSTFNLGGPAFYFANVYADNLHGDGSNITNIGAAASALTLTVTVKNKSGGSLAKGTVVHAAPSANPPSGNVIEVIAADFDTAADMPGLGILNETLANDAEGEAVMFGAVSGIDTSSFVIGQEVWVGNNGALTATKPTGATQLIQKIAVVIKSHATNGLIKVFGAGRTNDVPNLNVTNASISGGVLTLNRANATNIVYSPDLQDVTDNGSVTTNSITIGDGTVNNILTVKHSDNSYTEVRGFGIQMSRGTSYLRPIADATQDLYIGGAAADLDWNFIHLKYNSGVVLTKNGTETFRVDSNTRIMSGDLVVGSNTVIDSSRNFYGVSGSFSGGLSVTGGSVFRTYNSTHTDRRLTVNQNSGEYPRIYNFDEGDQTFHPIKIGGGNNETSGIVVDGSGNVTIHGTLNVSGTIDLSNANLDIGQADIVFDIDSSTAGARGLVWDFDGDGNGISSYIGYIRAGGTAGERMDFNMNAEGSVTGNNTIYRFMNGGSEVMSIGANGNVFTQGYFTSNGYIQSYGTLYTRSDLRVLNAAGTGWTIWGTRNNGTYDLAVGTVDSSLLTTDTLVIDGVSWNSGKVRIEGVSPNIEFRDSDTGSYWFQLGSNAKRFYILHDTDLDGSYETTYPFELRSDTSIGLLYGSRIFADNYHPNADKWTSARTVTFSGDIFGSFSIDGSADVSNVDLQVANDSHTHDNRYYTESEIQTFFDRGYINSESANNLPVGWYTIATNTGDRALGEFQIWDTASSDHQSVLFNASHHFGVDGSNDITVLANSRYQGTNFRYIRIKDGDTYDGAALQVYVDGATNSVNVAIVGGNAQSSGWVLKDWIPDATDPGDLSNYSSFSVSCTVDLDQILNGGIITTGEIYSGGANTQYRVFHDNYHPNADKWTTARTLTLNGDASGSVSWDGSANATLTVTVADNSHSHSNYITTTGNDERSGNLQLYGTNTSGSYGNAPIELKEVNQVGTDQSAYEYAPAIAWHWGGRKQMQMRLHSDGHLYVDGSNYGQSKVWTAGNDGSGSGLDADTVDGLQASQFLRSDTSDTMSGTLTVTGQVIAQGTGFKSTNALGMVGDYDTNGTADKIIWTIGDSWNSLSSHYGIGYDYDGTYGHHLVFRNNGSSYSRIPFSGQSALFSGGVKSPTFYDSNDTSAYADLSTGSIRLSNSSGRSAITHYDGTSGYLTFRGTTLNSTEGWGWSFTNQDVGATSYDTYFRIHYDSTPSSSYTLSTGSSRAPIFYDSDNTTYYTNPASTSNLNSLVLASGLQIAGRSWAGDIGTGQNYIASSSSTSNRGNYGAGIWAYSGYSTGTNRPHTYDATLQVMPASNMGFELSADWVSSSLTPLKIRSLRDCCQGWSPWRDVMTAEDTVDGNFYIASGSMRAPIFYDYNDTNYYVNPASTSTIRKTNIVASGSGWYDGLNLISSDASNTWNLLVDNGASDMFRVAFNGSEKFRIQTDGEVYTLGTGLAGSDFRAPIFYDSNNTAWYTDPASRSILNTLQLGGSSSDTSNLKLDVQGNMAIRGSSGLYYGVTTNNYNSWTTRMYASSSTQYFNAQQFNFDNQGYGSTTFLTVNTNGIYTPAFYDSDNTGYYVNPAGLSSLNNVYGNSFSSGKTIFRPDGATYVTSSSTQTGAIKITLPHSWTNTMLRMTIKVYEYSTNESFEIVAAGYTYGSSSQWINETAYIVGHPFTNRNYRVRFGHDGSKCCIYIGETSDSWSYMQINVTDVQVGYSYHSVSDWDSGWSIGFATSFGTITGDITNTQVGKVSNELILPAHSGHMHFRTNTHWDSQPGIDFIGTAGEFRMSSNTGNLNLRVDGWMIAHDYVQGDVFYDDNNTSYYVDPAGISVLNEIRFQGSSSRAIEGTSVNGNNTIRMAGNWETFDVMGRVLDWTGSNMHFGDGYNGVSHSSYYFRLGSSGNINYFHVGGDGYFEGDVIAYYSDARLKQNVKPIENALDIIKEIRGVTFEWNKLSESVWKKKEGDKDFGLIAQEVEAVFPMGVAIQAGAEEAKKKGYGDPDSEHYDPLHVPVNEDEEYKTVRYDKMVSVAIQAIKEQQSIIEELKQEIQELKKLINP